MQEGVFPSKLKQARVIPVYKSDDETEPENYRPISLLSIFNRIFKKIDVPTAQNLSCQKRYPIINCKIVNEGWLKLFQLSRRGFPLFWERNSNYSFRTALVEYFTLMLFIKFYSSM